MGAYNAAGWLVDRNVERGLGSRVAIRCGGDSHTYDDVSREVWRAQRALEALGIESGERVALVVNDEPAFVAWFLGGLRSGVVPVPLSTMLTGDELAAIVADAGAAAVVTSAEHAERIPFIAHGAHDATLLDRSQSGSARLRLSLLWTVPGFAGPWTCRAALAILTTRLVRQRMQADSRGHFFEPRAQYCGHVASMNNAEFQLQAFGDPRLAVHATSLLPAWLWSTDGARVLWANPVGAGVFGAKGSSALAEKNFGPAEPHRRQVARLAGRLPANGAVRLERLQGFGAAPGTLATCGCARLDFPDGSHGILVAAGSIAGRTMPMVAGSSVHFSGHLTRLFISNPISQSVIWKSLRAFFHREPLRDSPSWHSELYATRAGRSVCPDQ